MKEGRIMMNADWLAGTLSHLDGFYFVNIGPDNRRSMCSESYGDYELRLLPIIAITNI